MTLHRWVALDCVADRAHHIDVNRVTRPAGDARGSRPPSSASNDAPSPADALARALNARLSRRLKRIAKVVRLVDWAVDWGANFPMSLVPKPYINY